MDEDTSTSTMLFIAATRVIVTACMAIMEIYAQDPSAFSDSRPSTQVQEQYTSTNRHCVRYKMRGKWQEDPEFFEKFSRFKGSACRNADVIRDVWYDKAKSRWKRVPISPKKASNLTVSLQNLLNSILKSSNIPRSRRVFLKPNPTTMRASRRPLPPPNLLLAGVGPAMTASSCYRPEAEYSCGLVPVQVMLESEFDNASRHLSAAHANEIFIEQDNRRFVFALILTESYLRFYMFDPAGAVIVPRLDYHARPHDFCAIIEGIASLDEVRAGFDTSISFDGFYKKRIWTLEPLAGGSSRAISYIVKSRLFRARKFVGRATCCWLAQLDEEPRKFCVIKDSWIDISEERPVREGCLIRYANHKGVVRGLVRIRHEALVQVLGKSGDTTAKNRRTHKNAVNGDFEPEDRIHTRIVMDTYGKPLTNFSNKSELLLAFHDAVKAHRDLLLVAGILHRDISTGNILINPGGEEGDRGILIDLDLAARLEDLQPGCRTGTFRYMSCELLQRNHVKHSHLHDLESFYYVLCWIICQYDGPGDAETSRVGQAPEAICDWDCKSARTAAAAKRKHIKEEFELPVMAWFGEAITMLAKQLHDFFQHRYKLSNRYRAAKPHSSPSEDYAEYLGHIKSAIDALESPQRHTTCEIQLAPAPPLGAAYTNVMPPSHL